MAAPNDGSHGAEVISDNPSWPILASGNPSSPDGANLLPDAPQAGNHISIQAPLYSFYSQLFPSDLRRLRSAIEAKYLGRLCSLLQPRNVASQLGDIDKQFAVVWLDSETVVWGTKCNKLLIHNLRTGHVRGIPLVPVLEGVRRPKEKHNEYGKCGIHSVAINPSRTLLASGGDNPNDIMIYRLPDFKPVKTFLGHQDWVFGLNWITDEHLASGGRDGRMNLWTVSPREGLYHGVRCTRTNLLAKKSKVRESSYCWRTRELVALDPEGYIRQMDTVTWQVAAEWRVGYDDEDLICMNSQEHLVAAGGEQDLLLLDTRTRGPVLSGLALPHCDEEGLRSVRINRNIVSCGGSYGTLSFYDLAAGKWVEDSRAQPAQIAMLHVGPATCVNPTEEQRDIQQQLILADRDYMNECAVYCQDWDPSGKVLITGGGPLAIGLRGCYGAIWT